MVAGEWDRRTPRKALGGIRSGLKPRERVCRRRGDRRTRTAQPSASLVQGPIPCSHLATRSAAEGAVVIS
jgi:hypothetical protein